MRILKWTTENTQKDVIWNEENRSKIEMIVLDKNTREGHLRLFGYV